MPKAPNGGTQAMIAANNALGLLQQIAGSLQELVDDANTQREHLAFGAGAMERVLENWPIQGEARRVVGGKPAGGLYAVGAYTAGSRATDVLDYDAGRGGLSVINTGTVPCYVFLTAAGDAATGGAPTLYLAANGSGTWDGKVSEQLWCGPISAGGIGGATTLAVAII